MNKSRLNLPHIKKIIAYSLAAGTSQQKIAEALGTSQPTISRIARQADVQEMICREGKLLLETTESVLERVRMNPDFLAAYQKEVELQMFKSMRRTFAEIRRGS